MAATSIQETARQLEEAERRRLRTLLITLLATIVLAAGIYWYLQSLKVVHPSWDPTYFMGPIWSKNGMYLATIDGKILKYNKHFCDLNGVKIPSGATVVDEHKHEYIQP